MRVAQLSRAIYPLHGFGGLEQHVYQLTRHLAALGVEVVVITMPPAAETAGWQAVLPPTESPGPGIRMLPVWTPRLPLRRNSVADRLSNYPWFTVAAGRVAAELGRSGRIDMVHAHGLCAFGYGLRVPGGSGLAPMVANPHGMEEFKVTDPLKRTAYAPFRAMYRYGVRRAGKVIATDSSMVGEVTGLLGIRGEDVVILPNAIDPQECLSRISTAEQKSQVDRYGLGKASPILLSVGRLESNKGYHIMIEALHRVRDELPPNWVWLLVGEGTQRHLLESQVERLNLSERVRLLGKVPVSSLHNLYRIADIFVHPTLYEGSSIVTLEAMVHGRPVVATAVGGIPDKVIPGSNGLLCRPGDPDDLGRGVLDLARRPDAWASMGDKGARIARSCYSWDTVARDTLAVYERLMAEEGKWKHLPQ